MARRRCRPAARGATSAAASRAPRGLSGGHQGGPPPAAAPTPRAPSRGRPVPGGRRRAHAPRRAAQPARPVPPVVGPQVWVRPPGPSPARSSEAAPRQPRDAPAEPQWRWRGGRRRGRAGARALLGCWTAPRPPLGPVRALGPWRPALQVGLSPPGRVSDGRASVVEPGARECWAARGGGSVEGGS